MDTQQELVPVEECSVNPNYVNFKEVPLIALRQNSRLLLSKLLNIQKLLSSEENLPRDWRGIAHLTGLGKHRLEISNHRDPMAKVLQLWRTEGDKQLANFYHLKEFLGRIDRWDVADDISHYLVEDAECYQTSKQSQLHEESSPQVKSNFEGPDDNILTLDDVDRVQQGLPPQLYDAFVLFADEDIDFAAELIERMENFGFKLCVKERDLIGGVSFEHEAILRLISERCNRLIVIVSPSFLKSSANAFFVNFAQALGIEQGRRKILPCLYQKCVLPPTLNFYFLLNYQKSGKLCNFWDKLKDSIRSTPAERIQELQVPRITITEIDSAPNTLKQDKAESSLQSTLPIKAPRKRRDINISSSHENISHNCEKEDTNLSVSTNSVQSQSQIPCTASMINLNEVQPTNSNSVCDMSSSSITVNDISSSSQNVKKPKWYKQFFKSNPFGLLETKTTSNKTSSKRRLFRKKVAVTC